MPRKRAATKPPAEKVIVLRLFVSGTTPRSQDAIHNIKKMCEDEFPGQYDLQVFDIYQQPQLAKTEDILAVPVLIRKKPVPEKRMIGDMSNKTKVVKGIKE